MLLHNEHRRKCYDVQKDCRTSPNITMCMSIRLRVPRCDVCVVFDTRAVSPHLAVNTHPLTLSTHSQMKAAAFDFLCTPFTLNVSVHVHCSSCFCISSPGNFYKSWLGAFLPLVGIIPRDDAYGDAHVYGIFWWFSQALHLVGRVLVKPFNDALASSQDLFLFLWKFDPSFAQGSSRIWCLVPKVQAP